MEILDKLHISSLSWLIISIWIFNAEIKFRFSSKLTNNPGIHYHHHSSINMFLQCGITYINCTTWKCTICVEQWSIYQSVFVIPYRDCHVIYVRYFAYFWQPYRTSYCRTNFQRYNNLINGFNISKVNFTI